MRRAATLALALALAVTAAAGAQTPAPAGAVRVDLQPAKATVGDLVTAEVILVWDGDAPSAPPRFPVWQERWGSAEVREVGEVRESADSGGRRIYRQRVVLAAFAPGEVSLPPATLAVPLGDRTVELATPADTRFVVESVLPPPAAADAAPDAAAPPEEPTLRPAAPPLALHRDLAFPLFVVAFLGLALLAATLLLRRLRRLPVRVDGEVVLPPFDELRSRLGSLDASDGEVAHVAISTAFRAYLGRRFAFHARESTTSEIARRLRSRPVPTETVRRAVQLLRDCDRVKFAREGVDPTVTGQRVRLALVAAKEIETALEPPPESSAAPAKATEAAA